MAALQQDEFFQRVRVAGNPLAHPDSGVVFGHARFTVLTSRLIRLEWSANGSFEDRGTFAFPNRYAEPPRFATRTDDDQLTLDTGALVLRYRRAEGPFSADNLSITFGVEGQPQIWRPGDADTLNLRGTRRTLDGADGDVALETGLISRAGWAVFDDSNSVRFTADNSWIEPRAGHDLQDWYFFGYGLDYKAALQEYTRFGGTIPLVPRYVLGAWWSRYWPYSAQDLKDLVNDFAAHDLPLDVLVIDMDWHTPDGWTGYSWNRELFPDPEGFLKWVHERGLRATLNLHPADGVQPYEDVYAQFAAAMGVDPASKQPIPFRITDRNFVKNYFELLHHPLEKQGVDFWWMDWQQGETSEMDGLDPLPWINHLHFLDSARRGQRAMLYSRWGKLGNHRYQIGFSGDTFAVWSALESQPYFTATASNVGYGWWSHDIGGHFGAAGPELYTRWVQYGALSPVLRLHAARQVEAERRPWAFGEAVLQAVREAFRLRYRLVPYLYTAARVAHESGVSLCRPMYYEYPAEEAAYVARGQYFLGDQIIAAPITRPADPATGLAAVDVWVPPGEWFDFATQEHHTGPGWVRLVGDLERIPLLVRAGAIIALAPAAATTDAIPPGELTLAVFPGASGSGRIYADDGVSEAYRDGQYEWTQIDLATVGAEYALTIGAVAGRCESLPAQRRLTVRLEGSTRPAAVEVDGLAGVSWHYDAAARATIVELPEHDKHQALTLVVRGVQPRLDVAHKSALVRADVARLLPDLQRPADDTALLAAVMQTPAAGQADALARLGGPFISLSEFAAPEDAVEQLGRAVIAAPADGSEFDYTVHWTLCRGAGLQEATSSGSGVSTTQLIDCPFAFDGSIVAGHWTAEATLQWRGATIRRSYRSRPFFPSVPVWQMLVYNRDEQQLALTDITTADGSLNPQLEWQLRTQNAATIQNVNETFRVYLMEYWARLVAGERLAAYAATTVVSPDEREVVIYYVASCRAQFALNGAVLAEREVAPAEPPRAVLRSVHATHKSVVARLQPGANRLVAVLERPERSAWWYFAAVCARADGTLYTDLGFSTA